MPNGRALAMSTEEMPEQLATYGGALGTGVLLGWVASTRPTWAGMTTAVVGAGGAVGAMMTRGFASQMLEGMAAASMGALGALLPTILGGGAAKKVANRPAPKLLNAAPTNVVAEAISQSVRSGNGLDFG